MKSDLRTICLAGNLGMKCATTRKLMAKMDISTPVVNFDEDNPLDSLLKSIGAEFLEMKAMVDIRERAGMYQLMEELGFEVITLTVGDTVTHNVAFERKSGDWFSSLFGRKLFKQLHEIKENYPHSFLVVDRPLEDLFREAAKRKISNNAVIGGIASCVARGFPPMFLDNKEVCGKMMNAVALKLKDSRKRHDEYDPTREAPTSADVNLNILMRFPKMGWKAANTVMENCNNLNEAFDLLRRVETMEKDELKTTGLSRFRKVCINAAKVLEGNMSKD
jgi:ERCC4-type nuclease